MSKRLNPKAPRERRRPEGGQGGRTQKEAEDKVKEEAQGKVRRGAGSREVMLG